MSEKTVEPTEKILEELRKLNQRIDAIEKATPTRNELSQQIAAAAKGVDLFPAETVTNLIKEYVNKEITDAHFDQVVKDAILEKKDQLRAGVRAGLGVDKVRPLTTDDIGMLRKSFLEESESQKRTPAPLEKAGPEANASKNPFADLLKDYGGTE